MAQTLQKGTVRRRQVAPEFGHPVGFPAVKSIAIRVSSLSGWAVFGGCLLGFPPSNRCPASQVIPRPETNSCFGRFPIWTFARFQPCTEMYHAINSAGGSGPSTSMTYREPETLTTDSKSIGERHRLVLIAGAFRLLPRLSALMEWRDRQRNRGQANAELSLQGVIECKSDVI